MLAARQGASAGEKRKMEMIEAYPIPNSKEDILEFVLLATSRIKEVKGAFGAKLAGLGLNTGGDVAGTKSTQRFNEAWKVKCDQAYAKAKITFGSDKEALEQITSLLKEKKIIK
jgi:hypothetical protein